MRPNETGSERGVVLRAVRGVVQAAVFVSLLQAPALATDPAEGDLRLTGKTTTDTGLVEIYHDEAWGMVCDDNWDADANGANNAQVVCAKLGFSRAGTALTGLEYTGEGIWLDNVNCAGDEDGLHECPRIGNQVWGENNCTLSQGAGVTCSGETTENKVFVDRTALTIAEGDTTGVTYRIGLGKAPSANVTITVGGTTGTAVTATPSSLMFTAGNSGNWSTWQSVTVKADDNDNKVLEDVTLTHSAMDGGYGSVMIDSVKVRVLDNDRLPQQPNLWWVAALETAYGLSNSTLEVNWSMPDDDEVVITGYDVQYQQSEHYQVPDDDSWTDGPVSQPERKRTRITGLEADTDYYVRVRAKNASTVDIGNGPGNGDWSEPKGGRTGSNRPPTGRPVISGTAEVGETLRASTNLIEDHDGLTNASFSFQWIRVASDNIETSVTATTSTLTNSTYELVTADEGSRIKVHVSFTDGGGRRETVVSELTDVVAASMGRNEGRDEGGGGSNRPPSGQPTISGGSNPPQVGETLTADPNGITDPDGLTQATFGYQWIRVEGSAETTIADATSSTYTLTAGDEGSQLKVRVRFTDDEGTDEAVVSDLTGVVAAGSGSSLGGGSGSSGGNSSGGGSGGGTGGQSGGSSSGSGGGTGGQSGGSSSGSGGGPSAVPVGYLENPGPDSYQSGLGVISGWVCDADTVEIALNGVMQEAAYGTERADTQGACGDTDNGFGVLFNWNLLGDGEHAVVALADGVEFAHATVTVTTLGEEFVRGMSGECAVADFPSRGESVRVVWQEAQQNFVLAEGAAPTGASRSGTAGVGFLENPSANSFQSGLGVISGWVCAADAVTITLGDLAPQVAGYGTERLDTLDVCGDTDNGFGLLFNWNLLGDGEHEVIAAVDGVELGRTTVRVTTLGEEFVRGAVGECVVPDFPMVGETVTLKWQQASQNFVITQVE